jgi:DNA topoisomerase VI subunit B
VVIKELLDNAIDACETAGVAPRVSVSWVPDPATGLAQLTITDNGGGIPRERVRRIFNFANLFSDKAVYRSPTRGAQGNALKTVLGIPWALGVRAPLLIESQGRRHLLTPHVDPAGQVHIDHQDTATARQPGTRVALCLPTAARETTLRYWGRAFAVVNPHLSVQISDPAEGELACVLPEDGGGDLHQATVVFPGDGWRKYLPTDLASAWWYSTGDLTRLIFSHIGASKQRGGQDLLLREFVKQFRSLSRNDKAQAVCAALPGVTHLSDFAGNEPAVQTLHAAMLETGTPPSPDVLGKVGEDHFRRCFERWYGVKRFWYDMQGKKVLHEGIPCVVEVAIAETVKAGDLWTGINFSPTFDTIGANTWLRYAKLEAYGLSGALASLAAYPSAEHTPHVAVAVHIVCPTLEFLDKGKSRLKVPAWMADLLAKALWVTGRALYQEAEQREKDAAKAEQRTRAREREEARQTPTMTLKEAVFQVLPAAWGIATGDGQHPTSARWLYYPVRKLIQPLIDKELDFRYFSDLIVDYQSQGGTLLGLYYDPRGVLYEPHTGRVIALGTREVEGYVFPSWLYDKILYVEKKGSWPILQSAHLAERYDMAVIAGEGYASEAIRVLFEKASRQHDYQLFVLHDADPDGYNICRTLREETERMPGYAVDVIDLGLRWADAMALGLDTETFTRFRKLPAGLQPLLTAEEELAFVGRQHYDRVHHKTTWIAERVELNALTAPALVTYIEQRLAAVGVRGKIVPPEDHLQATARDLYRQAVASEVQDAIAALLPTSAITDQLQDDFTDDADLHEAETWITEAFDRNPALWWKEAVRRTIDGLVRDQRTAIRTAVRAALAKAIADGALRDPEEDEASF